jgi:hypothetical protein
LGMGSKPNPREKTCVIENILPCKSNCIL